MSLDQDSDVLSLSTTVYNAMKDSKSKLFTGGKKKKTSKKTSKKISKKTSKKVSKKTQNGGKKVSKKSMKRGNSEFKLTSQEIQKLMAHLRTIVKQTPALMKLAWNIKRKVQDANPNIKVSELGTTMIKYFNDNKTKLLAEYEKLKEEMIKNRAAKKAQKL